MAILTIEIGCKKKRLMPLLIVAMFSALPVHAENASHFRHLDKRGILATIIGKVITDEAHWSDYYRKDGTIETISMGTEEQGKWLIKNDLLCVTSKSTNECYAVWVSGNQVELRLTGIDYPYAAVIKDYKEH